MQKAFFLTALLWLLCHHLLAQNEDNVWLLGGNYSSPDSAYKACSIIFSDNAPVVSFIGQGLPYRFTNTSISDSSGLLWCYSNGKHIYTKDFTIMEGGENFYPNAAFDGGVNYLQGYILLPHPDRRNKVVYIYGTPKVVEANVPGGYTLGYINLKYSIADMNQNGGLGKVTQRDIIAGTDTLSFVQIAVIRHGNGRDWWVFTPHHFDQTYYRYLLSPEGLSYVGKQSLTTTTVGLGTACFSPNGQRYARFNWHGIIPDSSFATFDLYRFDRCSGLLSDRVSKTYDLSGLNGKPGGVAFSPNSRFLYVTRWDSIFQYDLHAPDIIASEKTVAVYDGFLGDLGLPTRFFYPLLAPDNKIYICVSNYNSPYLHTIESPDEPGVACNVQQHSVRLPVFNNFLLPNMPFYRLWDWEGSPCDTLGSVAVKEIQGRTTGFSVYPNPTSDVVHIELEQAAIADCRIELLSMTGELMGTQTIPEGTLTTTLPLENYPNGYYFLRVIDARQRISGQKITIIR